MMLRRTLTTAASGGGGALRPFHLAFPVRDLEKAKHFYGRVLGLPQGREDPGRWCDFDLFGHQIVCHQAPPSSSPNDNVIRNHVDNHNVPVPHFGVVMEWDAFHAFAARLRERSDEVRFEIEPTVRFRGMPGEQSTMFFCDPSGNALEFKTFRDDSKLFATK